jgi:3-deoxy-D-manno-octulosonic-acid transferase
MSDNIQVNVKKPDIANGRATQPRARRSNWWNGALWAYNAANVVFGPVILLKKWRRYQKKKYLYEIDTWRWSGRRPDSPSLTSEKKGPRVVFSASGIGEMRTMEYLSSLLKKERPDCEIVWAIRCRETCELARREHPEQEMATVPFEFLLPIWRWLRLVRPDVYVSVEKLWTPNLVWAARAWGARTIAVNSNSRGYNYSRWQARMWAPTNAWALRGFETLCLQRDSDREQLAPVLDADNDVRVTGMIKFESSTRLPETNENTALRHSLDAWLHDVRDVPLLLAGSTHPREEEFVLDAFAEVRQKTPCALLIAPRRVERASEVVALLQERGYQVRQRSKFNAQDANAQNANAQNANAQDVSGSDVSSAVYLLDTIGELATVYSYGAAAFIGGTLYMNGHNVAEPLGCGIATSFGLGNEKDSGAKQMRILCCEAGVGFEVKTPQQLAAHWTEIASDAKKREQIRAMCKELLELHVGAAQRNLQAILELLPPQESDQEN